MTLDPSGVFTSLAVKKEPSQGSVTITGSTAVYIPTTGYYGVDSFTYTATGPGGTSAAAKVTLTVANPPPPVAKAKKVTVTVPPGAPSGPITIDLSGSVTDASGLVIVTPPAHGTATVSGLTILYTPSAGHFGPDSFTYEAVGLPGSGSDGGVARRTFNAGAPKGDAGAGGVSAPAMVSVTIASPTLTITPTTLAPIHAANYSQTLTASGGTAPYVYTLSAGGLPPGLALSSAGVISGTPTSAGTFTFTVKATDSSTGAGPFFATQAYTLSAVLPGPVAAPSFTIEAAADRSGAADLSQGATGGPFTGAAVVSLSPSSAGTATISLTSTLPAAGGGTVISSNGAHYILTFKPALHFSGPATVTYTLANAFASSAPGTVLFQIDTRLDPTLDPDVKSLIGAQTDAARRFGEAQIENFDQRLETLHKDGYGRSVNGINLGISPDQGDPKAMAERQANGSWQDPFGLDASRLTPLDAAATPASTATSGPPSGAKVGGAKLNGGQTTGLDGAAPAKTPSDWSVWTGGGVDFGMHESALGRSGFHFTKGGISLGADYRWNAKLTTGLGAGYGQDATRIGNSGTKSTATNYVGVAYASYRPLQDFFLDGVFGYGQMSFDSRRFVVLDDALAYGKRHGDEAFLSLTAGYEYEHRQWRVSPYARLNVIDGTLDPFTETRPAAGSAP